jgi:hypothetical protein
MSTLSERAVLMKLSMGLPGQHRKDKRTTAEVKVDKGLGEQSGKWIKELWPEHALEAIKQAQTKIRTYHDRVTLPFGAKKDDSNGGSEQSDKKGKAIAGIGILPAALIMEYRDTMQQLVGEHDKLVQDFLADPQQWVDWAKCQHNGTFEADNYPGCQLDALGNPVLDETEFCSAMLKKFYVTTEPLPVPATAQFTETILSLLGVDADSVDKRVKDAHTEGQRELMKRMMEPVKAMAEKLVESPKAGRADIVFRDTLVDNITAICALGPKLNLTGDTTIDGFLKEMEGLTRYPPEVLRDDKKTRDEAAKAAKAMMDKLSGYKF